MDDGIDDTFVSPGAFSPRCSRYASPERERECLDTGIKKFDLELPVNDRLRLPDQLMQPLLNHAAVSRRVHIDAVSLARRLTVE